MILLLNFAYYAMNFQAEDTNYHYIEDLNFHFRSPDWETEFNISCQNTLEYMAMSPKVDYVSIFENLPQL